MPGRKFSSANQYRYGFNGKENDNEVKGEGNQQDYGMRISDPRLGRFLSVDPLSKKFAMLTPYQFASNTPVWAIDLDGLEAATINSGTQTLAIIIQGYIRPGPSDNKTQAIHEKQGIDYDGISYIADLAQDIPKLQVVVFSSSKSENTKNDVLTTIKNFKSINPYGTVIIAGHSLGADNAIELVNQNKNIAIDLLITLDIKDDWEDDNIPENVKIAINYYQTDDGWLTARQGEKIEIDNPEKTAGINIRVENTSHTKIDNDKGKDVANLILLAHKNTMERVKKEKVKESRGRTTTEMSTPKNNSNPNNKKSKGNSSTSSSSF